MLTPHPLEKGTIYWCEIGRFSSIEDTVAYQQSNNMSDSVELDRTIDELNYKFSRLKCIN